MITIGKGIISWFKRVLMPLLGEDSLLCLNPETVIVGSPLDDTKNPDVWNAWRI
jgi:hypothetical protein